MHHEILKHFDFYKCLMSDIWYDFKRIVYYMMIKFQLWRNQKIFQIL